MSDPDLDVAVSNQLVARSEVAPPPSGSQLRARDPGLRHHTEGHVTLPFAGQPGHGRAASLRRQPVRIVGGRVEGGYSNTFELICPACGDDPDLDYSQVPPRLQWLRGPRTLQAALAAYEKHLGLRPRPDEARLGSSGAGAAKTGMTPAFTEETLGGYRHEALLYSGMAEFLTGTTSFIRRAVNAGDPILVVVNSSKIGMLRNRLGAEAGQVSFADMAEVGANPGRIISAWRAFVQAHAGASQLYGIGEPVDPGRSPAELAECQLHEALLNVAFDVSTPFWLLCPYDLEALAADVIDGAHRTHPFVVPGRNGKARSSFRPINLADPFARRLPPRPAGSAYLAIQSGGLGKVRTFVADLAQRAGLDLQSATAIVQAVSEIASNSLQLRRRRGRAPRLDRRPVAGLRGIRSRPHHLTAGWPPSAHSRYRARSWSLARQPALRPRADLLLARSHRNPSPPEPLTIAPARGKGMDSCHGHRRDPRADTQHSRHVPGLAHPHVGGRVARGRDRRWLGIPARRCPQAATVAGAQRHIAYLEYPP